MALNQFMHPRNRYRDNKPDFAALAERYPEFRRHLSATLAGRVSLDFRDPEALRSLTCTLLREDFDIDLEIPLDRLIPTVPLRLNYILWVEDLLAQSGGPGRWTDIYGIDIGCGASCIYPLLGAKLNGWRFVASEVDASAAGFASLNVKRNNLHDKIRVIEATPDDMLCGVIRAAPRPLYHFTMCNPPFFGNILEAQGIMTSRSLDRPEPSSVSTAAEGEMVWGEGGEVDFVRRMIADSLRLREQVVWYTSMVGKKASLAPIKQELAKHKIRNVTTTEFCQGRTMRWGIGWTFYQDIDLPVSPSAKRFKRGKERPPLVIQVPEKALQVALQEASPGSEVTSGGGGDQRKVTAVAKVLEKLLKTLEIQIKPKSGPKQCSKYALLAVRNTWSNQRRKRRQSLRRQHATEDGKQASKALGSCPVTDETTRPTEAAGEFSSATVPQSTSEIQGVTCTELTFTGEECSIPKKQVGEKASDENLLFADEELSRPVPVAVVESSGVTLPDGLTPCQSRTTGAPAEAVKHPSTDSGGRSIPASDTLASGSDASVKESPEISQVNPAQKLDYKETCSDGSSSDEAKRAEGSPGQCGRLEAAGFLFKCTLTVRMAEGRVAIELNWTEGRTRESMHQVGQYIKNQLSKMAPCTGNQ